MLLYYILRSLLVVWLLVITLASTDKMKGQGLMSPFARLTPGVERPEAVLQGFKAKGSGYQRTAQVGT